MELVKNIFFNTDKLIQSSNVKISYTGKLFRMALKKYLFTLALVIIGMAFLNFL